VFHDCSTYFSFYWMICVFYSSSILSFSTVQTLQLRVVFVIHCLENFIYLRGSKNFLISVVVFYFLEKKTNWFELFGGCAGIIGLEKNPKKSFYNSYLCNELQNERLFCTRHDN
jgi:hypothetical protein